MVARWVLGPRALRSACYWIAIHCSCRASDRYPPSTGRNRGATRPRPAIYSASDSSQCVCTCSAERKQIALPAGVSAGLVAMLSHPLVAEAGVTPSLKNLLNSLIAGGVVLALIVAAVSGVAAFDPVARGRGK